MASDFTILVNGSSDHTSRLTKYRTSVKRTHARVGYHSTTYLLFVSEPLFLFLSLLPDVDVVLGGGRERSQERIKDAEKLVRVGGVGFFTEEQYHFLKLKSRK